MTNQTTDPAATGATPADPGAAGATPATPAAPAAGTAGPAGATPATGATPVAVPTPTPTTPAVAGPGLESALAAERKRAETAEKELKKLQDRDLTETQRLQKELEESKAALAVRDSTEKETKIRMATVSAAARLGYADPEDAVKLLDRAAIVLNEAGDPTNVPDLLSALLKAKPYYASAAVRPTGTLHLGGGQPAFTQDQIGKMSASEVADNWPAIVAATGGKLPRT
jgi:hypothetical protein